MRKLLFIFFIGLYQTGFTQDMPVKVVPNEIFRNVKKDPADTASWSWKRGGIINVNFAQGSLSNWAAGGDNFSMSLNSYVNYRIFHKGPKHNWDNNLDFNFGLIQSSSLGSRKNDDRLDLLSKYGIRIDSNKRFFVSGLFNLRTQFFDGYTYSGGTSTFSSTFFSPAYLLLSLGIDYRPKDNISFFLSPVTMRNTFIANKWLSDKGAYGVPPGKHSLSQIGAFGSINYNKQLFKNVVYKGKLDLFTDYRHNPENVDMYFTNFFNFKINRFLSATYSLDMIYDDDVKLFGKDKSSPALQVKSLIGIGFSMPFSTVVVD